MFQAPIDSRISLVKLAGNSDTSDFSAVTATVLASVALMSAAVVLLAKKKNA